MLQNVIYDKYVCSNKINIIDSYTNYVGDNGTNLKFRLKQTTSAVNINNIINYSNIKDINDLLK